MRIRERKSAADCSVSSSSTSSSSLSSQSSSITAAHSLVSSQGSSIYSRFSPPPLTKAFPRCRGLDLLVKAIHQVDAGSIVGVPYIQRRVTIRRRRRSGRIDFDAFVFDELSNRKGDRISKKVGSNKKPKV